MFLYRVGLLLGIMVYSQLCFSSPKVKYEIALQDEKQCLHIQATLNDIEQDDFRIYFPQAGIQSVDFNYASGSSVESTEYNHIKKVLNPTHDTVNVRYDLCLSNPLRNIDYPILEEHFYHITSRNTLAQPMLDDSQIVQYDIHFKDFQSKHRILTSYSLDQEHITIEEKASEFQNFMTVAGKLKVDTFKIQDAPIYVIEKGVTFLDKDYLASLKQVMRAHKTFWNDKTRDFTLITLVGKDGTSQMLGRHYKNAMSMWLDNEHPDWPLAIRSISHELFHEWNGMRLKFKNEPYDLQWYSEGFTDYYGLRLARESGAMTDSQYIEQINDLIKVYLNSPIQNADEQDIIEKYYFDGAYNYLAMLRGHLTLFMMEFLDEVKDIKSFDTIFREIYDEHIAQKLTYVNKDLLLSKLDILGKHWRRLKGFIDGAKHLKLPQSILNGQATLQEVLLTLPDYGFDEYSFLSSHIIKKLKEDSAAFKAGVRENDKVVFHNLGFRTPHTTSKIVVKRDGELIEIKFTPDIKMVEMPQYQWVSDRKNA